MLDADVKVVLGLPNRRGERRMITVHNQTSKPCRTDLAPGGGAVWGKPVHLFGRGGHELGQDGPVRARLGPYGWRWLRVRRAGEPLRR